MRIYERLDITNYNEDWLTKYENLFEQAKSEVRKKTHHSDPSYIYYEEHHIIPKCYFESEGGLLKENKDEPANLVLLTAREHILGHYYLMKAFPKEHKLKHACWNMFNRKSIEEIEKHFEGDLTLYEEARHEAAKATVERLTGVPKSPESKKKNSESNKRTTAKKKENGTNYTHTEERKQIISEKLTGKEKSDDHCYNLSKSLENRENTPKSNQKRSKTQQGRKFTDEQRAKMSKIMLADYEDGNRVPVIHTDETKRIIRETHLGTKQSLKHIELRIAPRRKPILCIELDKVFRDASACAEFIGSKFPQNIQQVCSKSNRTAGGYHWAYTDQFLNYQI